MSRVLLFSVNRCTSPDPVFPLGLAHLNTALRAAGHETRWADVLTGTGSFEALLHEFQPAVVALSIRNIDDVLIRKQQTFFDDVPTLCAAIRRHGARSVLGGSGFSIFPRELLEMSGADYGIAGAGEASLVALVETLEQRRDPAAVPGLLVGGGQLPGQGAVEHAPYLPQSAASDDHIPAAEAAWYLRTAGMLNVQTQRGCGFHCCYCTYPVIEGRAHRRRAPEQIAAEFARAARLGAKYVFVVDSVFNSSPRHVHDVCEALLRQEVPLAWGCFLRPQGLTPELVRLMARAGLSHAEFGSDSFSDPVLAAYQKGFTFDDILVSSEALLRARVDFCHFLICGGPGETEATLRESYSNSQRLKSAIVMGVVGMRIYPGTALQERAIAEGVIARDTRLLEPRYYLAPGLTPEGVFARLQEFAAASPNWIVGDPAPAYASLVARLRSRGVAGPLWSYLSMMQRLWPHGINPHTVAAPAQ